ncbi:MAG: bifunctional diguanylate cyclase/phosphodiesterase [Lachnospiraceae bacterium]|nr:bifunctional diguanylate cyclase/phosphodiesterase [Lachnospiraceae bacterium]
MGVTAVCVGSIFDKNDYLRGDAVINDLLNKGEHVLLVPSGVARYAGEEEHEADFLYFLCGGLVSRMVMVRGGAIDESFAASARSRMNEYGITLDEIGEDDPLPDAQGTPWTGDIFTDNRTMAIKSFGFSEKLLNASKIEEVSEALKNFLAEDTFICIRESFLQDLYTEVDSIPGSGDRFYILADNRKRGKEWETFELGRMFPGASDLFNSPGLTTILPVHSGKSYYGYMVHSSKECDSSLGAMEMSSVVFDLMIGRYITEKKLLFASHELLSANESVRRLKETDVLTGLLNRQGFMIDAKKLFLRSKVTGQSLLTVCVDLERLGNINDVYGHHEGDVAIQTLSKMIQETLISGTVAGRLGADEFMLLSLVAKGDEENLDMYFRTLKTRLQNYNRISGKEYTLEINLSTMLFEADTEMDLDEIINEALAKKRHIKESKGSIRNISLYEDGHSDSKEHAIVSNIMDNNGFLYAFQPIVSAKTGEIVAYEALMRTKDMHLSPLTVLKYASMDSRLYDIEKATFSNVFRQVKPFIDELGDRKLFVNSIPGSYLNEKDYQELKEEFGFIFPNLVVEITEQTDFENETVDLLRKRSEADGFKVAVDDFGTGFSNLSNLLKFLPDYVKIDRALIEDIHEDLKKQHFVNNIVEFAHDNGFLALAEGVESPQELASVVRMGVDLIQGYYTAKPAYVLAPSLSTSIKDEIVRASFEKSHELKKKVFLVTREKEIFLMHLAMERYTSVIISQPEVTLQGNPDFMAGITIKIKDNTECKLTLHNVSLGDMEERPLIDIGKGAKLTLVIDGDNELLGNGIHVPEGAELKLEGAGTLTIAPTLAQAYGIGSDADNVFGKIVCAMEGALAITAEGNRCVAIGGGQCASKDGIRIISGRIDAMLKGTNCVGIGSYIGDVPLSILGCDMRMDARISSGILIGALRGEQNITIRDASLVLSGSGSVIAGIGTFEEMGGKIDIRSAGVHISFNGKRIYMIGTAGGKVDIRTENMNIDMHAEGNMAMGIGSADKKGTLKLIRTTLSILMRAGEYVPVGAYEDNIETDGGVRKLFVNEEESTF